MGRTTRCPLPDRLALVEARHPARARPATAHWDDPGRGAKTAGQHRWAHGRLRAGVLPRPARRPRPPGQPRHGMDDCAAASGRGSGDRGRLGAERTAAEAAAAAWRPAGHRAGGRAPRPPGPLRGGATPGRARRTGAPHRRGRRRRDHRRPRPRHDRGADQLLRPAVRAAGGTQPGAASVDRRQAERLMAAGAAVTLHQAYRFALDPTPRQQGGLASAVGGPGSPTTGAWSWSNGAWTSVPSARMSRCHGRWRRPDPGGHHQPAGWPLVRQFHLPGAAGGPGPAPPWLAGRRRCRHPPPGGAVGRAPGAQPRAAPAGTAPVAPAQPPTGPSPGPLAPDGGRREPSKRWQQTSRRLAQAHAKIANLRGNALHHLTSALAGTYGAVVVEHLNIAGMLRNHGLAGRIADAGWEELRRQLGYKTAWAGGTLVQADTFYPSSKTCSGCGHVKAKLPLSERTYRCERCGLVLDRDENAARNLAALVLTQTGAEVVAGSDPETRNARGADVRPGLTGQTAVNQEAGTGRRPGETGTVGAQAPTARIADTR